MEPKRAEIEDFMAPMEDYVVVQSHDRDEFTRQIKAYAQQGYRLAGEPDISRAFGDGRFTYTQPMAMWDDSMVDDIRAALYDLRSEPEDL
ncbi:hypothetical protein [Streptomyces sp. NPDC002078]